MAFVEDLGCALPLPHGEWFNLTDLLAASGLHQCARATGLCCPPFPQHHRLFLVVIKVWVVFLPLPLGSCPFPTGCHPEWRSCSSPVLPLVFLLDVLWRCREKLLTVRADSSLVWGSWHCVRQGQPQSAVVICHVFSCSCGAQHLFRPGVCCRCAQACLPLDFNTEGLCLSSVICWVPGTLSSVANLWLWLFIFIRCR